MSYKLVILGAGESGTGAALLAAAKGLPVFVSDAGPIAARYKTELSNADIPFEENGHSEGLIMQAEEVVKSPGIPDKAPLVKKLHEAGIPVISELEFAYRFTRAKFIAITGSNGKTTTTLLTYHLMKEAGRKTGLAGNVGFSLARQVIADEADWYVLEISSFQLDGMFSFKADIAVLLNITPDHLDRYDYKFENYIASKFRITQNQSPADTFITWADSTLISNYLAKHKPQAKSLYFSFGNENQDAASGQRPHETNHAAYLSNGSLIFPAEAKTGFELHTNDLPLRGPHNNLNVMAAVLAVKAAGLSDVEISAALPSFRNAPHRLEDIATINGVRYVNDSKATNVDSVKYALGSFTEPLVLIAGGKDKGNDYTEIEQAVSKQVKALVCMGLDNSPLIKAFGNRVPVIKETGSATEAVQAAAALAAPGDVVLLSPACASFDLFKNYEDRGDQFRSAVLAMKAGILSAEPEINQALNPAKP